VRDVAENSEDLRGVSWRKKEEQEERTFIDTMLAVGGKSSRDEWEVGCG
jgi:hypothetical protein